MMIRQYSISLFLFLLLTVQAYAYNAREIAQDLETQFYGELNFTNALYILPTGQRGHSSFKMQNIKLGSQLLLNNNKALELLFEGAEKRDATSGRFEVQVKEAYLDLLKGDSLDHAFRFGLIPNPWIEMQKETGDLDFLGNLGKATVERNNYLSYSDLGVMYLYEFQDSQGHWSLSFVNGEGLESDEVGPRKEGQFYFEKKLSTYLQLNLGYILGSYDQYDSVLGRKERALFQLTYAEPENYIIGLELIDAHDPADSIVILKMAQSVDLNSRIGENVHGQMLGVFSKYYILSDIQAFLKYEILQAAVGDKDKKMQSIWLGTEYQYDSELNLALAYYYSGQPEKYGSDSSDQSLIELAARVSF